MRDGTCWPENVPQFVWIFHQTPVLVRRTVPNDFAVVRVRRGNEVHSTRFRKADLAPETVPPEYGVSVSLTVCGMFPDIRLVGATWEVDETTDGYRVRGRGDLIPAFLRVTFEYAWPESGYQPETMSVQLLGERITVEVENTKTAEITQDEIWIPHLPAVSLADVLPNEAFGGLK